MSINLARMQNNRKRIYLIAFLFMIPVTFYFGPITDASYLQNLLGTIWTYPEFYMTTFAYILIFYVLLSNKDTFWKPFFVIGSWLLLVSSVVYSLDDWHITQSNHILTILKYVFVQSKGMWPVESFMTVSLVLLALASVKNFSRLKRELRVVFTEKSIDIKKINTYLIGIVGVGILATMTYVNFHAINNRYHAVQHWSDYSGTPYSGGMYTIYIYGGVHLALNLILIALSIVLALRVVEQSAREFKAFIKTLADFRLNTYVTRTIAGYIYTTLFFIIVTSTAVLTPFSAFNLFSIAEHSSINIAHPLLWLIFLGVPLISAIITFLALLIVRLSFEATVALVHIAENTYKSSRGRY